MAGTRATPAALVSTASEATRAVVVHRPFPRERAIAARARPRKSPSVYTCARKKPEGKTSINQAARLRVGGALVAGEDREEREGGEEGAGEGNGDGGGYGGRVAGGRRRRKAPRPGADGEGIPRHKGVVQGPRAAPRLVHHPDGGVIVPKLRDREIELGIPRDALSEDRYLEARLHVGVLLARLAGGPGKDTVNRPRVEAGGDHRLKKPEGDCPREPKHQYVPSRSGKELHDTESIRRTGAWEKVSLSGP
jgi:hypothetical protein